jgi:hypothetical protein
MQKVFEFRPPLPLSPLPAETADLSAYAAELPDFIPNYLIVLMQAGHAALGYFEEGEVYFHKVISKYMVRKKQGKAQLKHLNQKGKSRAGSRIRLANTQRFFEDISDKLHEWLPSIENLNRILFSASPTLWAMLFEAKNPPPFDQRDRLLVKIPLDVGIPKYEELLAVNEKCLRGRLIFHRPFFHDELEIDSEEL